MNDKNTEDNLLEEARNNINDIDRQMAHLFEQRMRAVESVISYKQRHNLPLLDAGREHYLIDKNRAYISKAEYIPYYIDFIKHIIDISKQYQANLAKPGLIGYQGVRGAFSHMAVLRIFGQAGARSYATFQDVFQAVQSGELAFGVVPFENSYTGEVGEVLDLLYNHQCYIHAIYDLPIVQNLLVPPGATLNDIRQVYSHQQALSQCQEFLRKLSFEQIPAANTALAARLVSEAGDRSKAAIASEEAAAIYGLEVLVPAINSSARNTTRFIIIKKALNENPGNTFSLLFTLGNMAGELARVVKVIADHGFNMENIKSRSMRNLPWQYYFYVEMVGNAHSRPAADMLAELKEICPEVKLLGVYNK